jgi:uncharacterized protein
MAEITKPTEHPSPAGGPERRSRDQPTMPAGKVLVAMLVCLLLWTFLFAPTLKRSAEASPVGARRTVSLVVLGPFSSISSVLQVTKLTDALGRALGRDPNEAPGGEVVIPPEPIPSLPGGGANVGQPHATGPIRNPTARNKLRVVVVGDSLAAGLGTYLERVFKPSLVRVARQGRISTGLARPDYFNWPSSLELIVDEYRPDLVIVMMGENDNQSLRNPGGRLNTPIGTFAWPQVYEERVAHFMHIATSNGSRVVWAGLPVTRDVDRWALIRRQNDIFERAAGDVDDVAFVDTWELFSAPGGGYTAYFHDGETVRLIREPDGLHFNSTGYELLARAVAETARSEFGLPPKTIED